MTTPSPLCTINSGGAGLPADVAANSTVNIALAVTASANFWSLTVLSTDETNVAATIAATLVVNQTTKTATLTAPSGLGSAVILQSQVGVKAPGLDANGAPNPAFTCTLKINVLSAGGHRVLAANESAEQDAAFGWIRVVNALLRS
jgi:hypothetical protein